MEAPMKFICLLGLLVIVSNDWAKSVDGASACGKSTPDNEAFKLAPCAAAAADEAAAVSDNCCLQVKRIGQNPSCLCAVMLSNTAKISGINPEIAITIPKRCNIATRPVGYKCGREYTSLLLGNPYTLADLIMLKSTTKNNISLIIRTMNKCFSLINHHSFCLMFFFITN